MALSFFSDKNTIPSEAQVGDTLGEAVIYWDEVKKYISGYGAVRGEWRMYSQKAGWCKKLLLTSDREERNIVFLYPNRGYFTSVMVFGERAVETAEESELPGEILRAILQAKVYREGRSFNMEVRNSEDLAVLKKLIHIKIHH